MRKSKGNLENEKATFQKKNQASFCTCPENLYETELK